MIATERGAVVGGALQFPSARELANADVLVIYKGDAGYLGIEDRATLDSFMRRGGGVVSLHDALCGPEPEQFANIVGGAKKHGEVNYTLEAEVPYTIADPSHPIMQGMSGFTITDEAFFNMTWSKAPEITVLATATMAATPSAKGHEGEVVPQIWTYERSLAPAPSGKPYRAFVWMQGHNYANFALPNVQAMLLRGIAWAGQHPVDALSTVRPQRTGGRGRGRGTAAPAEGRGRGGA
jgi:type 1 glutamine amidotransferase